MSRPRPPIATLVRLAGLGACLALALTPAVLADDIRYPGYFPSFPAPAPATGIAPNGSPGTWLGGDGPFCCPLDATRSFWSFCDPGIGLPGARDRIGSHGIGNTIAIATCKDGRFTPQHFYKGSADSPVSYFPDPDNPGNKIEGTRFWLRKAFLHKGVLYIFAHQVCEPGSAVYNSKIIRVSNPLDSPTRWKYDLLGVGVNAVPRIGEPRPPAAPIHFGNEAFVDVENNYVYTYGEVVREQQRPDIYFSTFKTTAFRFPLDKLETSPPYTDMGRFGETMTAKFNEWKPGLYDPADFYDVGIPAVIGYTVRFNATLKAFQVVFSDDRAIFENIVKKLKPDDPAPWSVFLMTGPSPYGPWTRPVPIARYPEMDPARAGQPGRPFNPDDYAYAIGEQPAFEAHDADVVFTYAVSSLAHALDKKNTRLQRDLKAYNTYGWRARHPSFAQPEPPRAP